MIGAMHDPAAHLLTDASHNTVDDSLAYSSACTVVYTKAKEVS